MLATTLSILSNYSFEEKHYKEDNNCRTNWRVAAFDHFAKISFIRNFYMKNSLFNYTTFFYKEILIIISAIIKKYNFISKEFKRGFKWSQHWEDGKIC